MATKEEILDSIASLTVLELSELLKDFEERFGVTAAAPVAVAAPAAGGGGGGGGDGAIRKVTNCCLGNTSVNHNGTRIRTATRQHCRTTDSRVAQVLRLR